jgi:hypothetical protein
MERVKAGRLQFLGRFLLVVTMLAAFGLSVGGNALAVDMATVGIDPAAATVSRGEVFDVDVVIEGADDLGAYEFAMAFDPDVVEVVDVVDGGFLGSTGRDVHPVSPVINNTTGMVTFAASSSNAGTPGPDGDGTLAVITLEAVGRGASDLDLGEVIVSNTEAEPAVVTVQDGMVESVFEFEVVPASEGQIVNLGTFTEMIEVHGAVDLGSYQFSLAFDPDVVQVTDVTDASFLGSTGRDVVPAGPDIDNEAGVVTFAANSTDAGTPGPDGDGVLAMVTFEAVATGETELDLFDLIATDTDAVPEVPDDVDGFVEVVEPLVSIDPEEVSVSNCAEFEVDVMAEDVVNLGAYEFALIFDPDVVEVTGVENGPFLESTGRTAYVVDEDLDNVVGMLTFAAASHDGELEGPDGDGVLATVTFEAVGVGTSDLELMDVILADTAGMELPGPVTTDGMVEVTKEAVGFEFETIADQVAGEPFDVTITAVNEDGDPAVNFSGPVALEDSTGTLVPDEVVFDGPEVTASMTITKAEEAITITAEGMNACGVTITGESNPFEVEHADAVAVHLTPVTATVMSGDAISYTLMAEDAFGNMWDVTAEAAFSIEDDAGGSFVDNVYTADMPGTWTVTGTYEGLTDTAELTVEGFDLFMPIIAKNFTP